MRRIALAASVLAAALAFTPLLFAGAPTPAPTNTGTAAPAMPPGMPPGGAPATGRGRGGGARGPVSATQPVLGRGYDSRHTDFLQIARLGGGKIDVLFVGDSITDMWSTVGRSVWDKNFVPLQAANFGIGGDTTQSVLWRMQNGELDGFKAKVIILMLGTNNINNAPNAEIAEGDRLIIEEFKRHQPQAKVLVLGIFPRAASATDPYRANIKEINAKLATFADNKQVFFLDIGEKFLQPDGTLTTDIMGDLLHPTVKGYEIWTAAMMPKVQELMKP
jgi:lysophospholipase L1-like esterase